MRELVYADPVNLALLKEATMNFITEIAETDESNVAQPVSLDISPSHLVKDLLTASRKNEKITPKIVQIIAKRTYHPG